MSDLVGNGWRMKDAAYEAVEKLERLIIENGDEYLALARRYDDALKRIADLQAELDYLRREVNR